MKVYVYEKCETCRRALKYLDAKSAKYTKIPIVEQPPTVAELKRMVGYLEAAGQTFKKLFNTSGALYRELKVGDRLKAGMTESEALDLLSKNGKLIKRPFILTPHGGTVGFWEEGLRDLMLDMQRK